MKRRTFYFCAAAIALLAFMVREWFVLAAVFPDPLQGDSTSYLRYALHILRDGTFAQTGNGETAIPDAYRGPGYPLILAALGASSGGESWLPAIQQFQVIAGSATVCATIAIAYLWLGRAWALLAGVCMALEPHHIAATGAVLTEVTFGFFVSVGLLGALCAAQRRSAVVAGLAGCAFAFGYLVNPIIALFPFVLLPWFLRAQLPRQGMVVAAVSLLAIGGWFARNQMYGISSLDRAAQNFVVGSWPDYDHSWKYQRVDPDARRVLDQSGKETEELISRPGAGLQAIFARMSSDYPRYLAWYLLRKPYLLWDWNIRIGAGGVNSLETKNSPLDTSIMLRTTSAALEWGNPVFFGLAVLGAILGLREKYGYPIAAFFCYVTVLHAVLQAEPRYSIPYKFAEALLVANALAHVIAALRNRKVLPQRPDQPSGTG